MQLTASMEAWLAEREITWRGVNDPQGQRMAMESFLGDLLERAGEFPVEGKYILPPRTSSACVRRASHALCFVFSAFADKMFSHGRPVQVDGGAHDIDGATLAGSQARHAAPSHASPTPVGAYRGYSHT